MKTNLKLLMEIRRDVYQPLERIEEVYYAASYEDSEWLKIANKTESLMDYIKGQLDSLNKEIE